MKILLVEDELKTAEFIQRGLSENSFVVDLAATGHEGVELALINDYDLIVLDVMLPGPDGWTILSMLRAGGHETPILLLTARDAVEDRVKGLEMGADDYLVKPFAFSELLARIRNLLKRHSHGVPRSQELRVGDLELNLLTRRVHRDGRRIDLTANEFLLLALLMRRTGEVLSRAVIAEQVWDMNFDSNTNVIDVAVQRLRRKVDEPFASPLIHTMRGMGYVLEQR